MCELFRLAISYALMPPSANTGPCHCVEFYEIETNMNKKFLVSVPAGAGVGTAIYQGLLNGFFHLDWYRVVTIVLVTFVITLPMVFFFQQKK
ncbi:hypothetical protein LPN04_06185 [Rugamonas sp. A1-17]|nr:hypothetical protein [Rugamonas sp. A1-17]